MTPRLSVVVPTRDRADLLTRCLASLRASLRPGDELVVADSASEDPAVAARADEAGATVVRCDRPGASRARNAGWRVATHDVVAFVDDDVQVAAGWAGAMAEAFAAAGADVGFVSGRVTLPPEQGAYPRPVALHDRAGAHGRLDANTAGPVGNSANLGVRRTALDAVGGFDEALGGGAPFEAAEDLDLYDRLFAAGFVGVDAPDALAWHEQWRTRRQLVALDWRYGIGSGARLAKLARTDPRRARFVARDVLVRGDLHTLGRTLRRGEEFAALTTAVRLAGTAVGVVRAARRPVRDGRYVVGSASSS